MDQNNAQPQDYQTTVMPRPKWSDIKFGSFALPEQLAFLRKVYAWMCAGLVVTGIIAYLVSLSPALSAFILGNNIVFFAILISELVAVIYLSRMVHKISAAASALIFLAYAALNGLTLSFIFFAFQINSIATVFFITAGLFGAVSLYGYVTKRNLTTIGAYAVMALFGLIIAMLINLFIHSDQTTYILSVIGVLVFTVLTAYDTQKLKWLYEFGRVEGVDGDKKEAVNGALTLYLDFINLFIDLLVIFGKRR